MEELPVIYLSARNQPEDLAMGFETGANDYLTKPISKKELLARVTTHLELLDINRNLDRKVRERTEALREANRELERLATLDGLTGIPNRRRFDDELQRAWADHRRRSAPLSLIMADIDHFKRYNDTYGHQAGDQTLSSVAQTLLLSSQRTTDLAARYGGEEFVVLLPDTKLKEATRIAQKMNEKVGRLEIRHEASLVSDFVSISLGVASLVPDRDSAKSVLMDLADRALYEAKEKGRNQVAVAAGQ